MRLACLPDCRRWEQPLLSHYLERLRALGVESPSFDDAWIAHRRDVMWGFYVWFFNAFTYQTEPSNTAACTRFATAMIDHDTVSLLAWAGRSAFGHINSMRAPSI